MARTLEEHTCYINPDGSVARISKRYKPVVSRVTQILQDGSAQQVFEEMDRLVCKYVSGKLHPEAVHISCEKYVEISEKLQIEFTLHTRNRRISAEASKEGAVRSLSAIGVPIKDAITIVYGPQLNHTKEGS